MSRTAVRWSALFALQVHLKIFDIVGTLEDERQPKHSGNLDSRYMTKWNVLLRLNGRLDGYRINPTLFSPMTDSCHFVGLRD